MQQTSWSLNDPTLALPNKPSDKDRKLAGTSTDTPIHHALDTLWERTKTAGGVLLLLALLAWMLHVGTYTVVIAWSLVGIAVLVEIVAIISVGTDHHRRIQQIVLARARVDTWTEWEREHQINRDDLPGSGPGRAARDLADRLVAVRDVVHGTRAWTENWIGAEWHPELDRQVWSMIDRLRDSVETRTALAEAAGRPALEQDVSTATDNLAALDAEATALCEQIGHIGVSALAVDAMLAERDTAKAEAQRDVELRARLLGTAGTTDTTSVTDHRLRQLRDQVLNSAAGTDLSILQAQLRAVTGSDKS
jgi:hypothetical protein